MGKLVFSIVLWQIPFMVAKLLVGHGAWLCPILHCPLSQITLKKFRWPSTFSIHKRTHQLFAPQHTNIWVSSSWALQPPLHSGSCCVPVYTEECNHKCCFLIGFDFWGGVWFFELFFCIRNYLFAMLWKKIFSVFVVDDLWHLGTYF